jgi:hypothetical protein
MRPRITFAALVVSLTLLGSCSSGGRSNAGIGPAGGTVVSADGLAEVVIPPGALSSVVDITIRVASAPPAGHVGTAYEFGPDGTTFAAPVTITIVYDEADLPVGAVEADIRLGTVASGAWAAAAGSTVDTVANTVTAETNHFSMWAIVLLGLDPPAGIPRLVFANGNNQMFVYEPYLPEDDRLWQVDEDGWWPAWRTVLEEDSNQNPVAVNTFEIAYTGLVGGNSAILLANVNTGGGTTLFQPDNGEQVFHPAWSPDGNRISFSQASADGLNAEIWVVDRNTSNPNPRRLTLGAYDVRSTWSPDGTMIAFERDGQGIFKVPADGSSGAGPLFVDANLAPAAPDWGPRGIVFQAYQPPIPNPNPPPDTLFVGYRVAWIDENGTPTSLRWLTWGGTQIGDYAPKWSQDEMSVLFVRERASDIGIGMVSTSDASPDSNIPTEADAGAVILPTGGSEVLGADW